MSSMENCSQTQENISCSTLKNSEGMNMIDTQSDNKLNYENGNLPTTPSKTTNISTSKLIKIRLSIDNKIASITDTLSFNTKRSIALERDKKTYESRCEAITNRIEALKKQEMDMQKRVTKINRHKVTTAKVKAEKTHRSQLIEDIRKEIDQEIIEKKKKAQVERVVGKTKIKEVSQKIKEEKKKKYEKRINESKRASSLIIECRKQIEDSKKSFCDRVKEDIVDPKKIKTNLRRNKEVKRNLTLEKKIQKDESYTEQLKIRLKELEKQEENVFQQVSNTIRNNEDILHNYSLNNSTSDLKPIQARTTRAKKQMIRTKSACSKPIPFLEDSARKVKEMQDKYQEKIIELNQLINNEKKSINARKK